MSGGKRGFGKWANDGITLLVAARAMRSLVGRTSQGVCSLTEELSDSGVDGVSLAPQDTVATVAC